MVVTVRPEDARADWEQRIGQRTATDLAGDDERLPPPAGLTLERGAGLVTLRWRPVAGAMGYLVHRADSADGPFSPVDHGGQDVLAVPGSVYADATGEPGRKYWYAVASIRSPEQPAGPLSAPLADASLASPAEPVEIDVDAGRSAGRLEPIWRMIGSEHLSYLLSEETTGGRPIGAEFDEALRIARAELGADRVRAHSIFHDDLGVYREVHGEPCYDFSVVDRIYDRLLELGIRPVPELSFMPRDLASDPTKAVFQYRGIISPPKDWSRWAELNRRVAAHLVERFGLDEVRHWPFEVWNEANLDVFWTGTKDDYFRLYDLAARAIKEVDERLVVGGPSTAAAEWVTDFLDFARATGSPVDFVSTHTYGNYPLDVREAARARGRDDVKVYWTEWGVTPTHFKPINDSVFAAPFVLHGMKCALERADALAYWVVSDHFEELGRPPKLFHGGFGLLSVGNLRKPRFWALALLEALGQDLVSVELAGDGAGASVDALAARKSDGSVDVLVWNGVLAQVHERGNPLLDRRIRIRIDGLEAGRYDASLARVDETHSNVVRHWQGASDWPTDEQWAELHAADCLEEEALPDVESGGGTPEFAFALPMPGIARLRLVPTRG
jgi:xylan 1,4-beta-xylosidase